MPSSRMHFVALLLMLVSLQIAAEQPDASIDASPKLCVVRTQDEWCTIDVQLAWQSNTEEHYCIKKSRQSAALKCWPSASLGEFLDHVKTREDTEYQLVWMLNGVEYSLDESTLNVVHVVPEDRRRARRRKHIWSVF